MLAYYSFWGAEPADKYLLGHNLFKTAISISHFAHLLFFHKKQRPPQASVKTFLPNGRFFFRNLAVSTFHFQCSLSECASYMFIEMAIVAKILQFTMATVGKKISAYLSPMDFEISLCTYGTYFF